MGFADLHTHVLPGLDDGARSLEESIQLSTILSDMGFDLVCATPHQRLGFFVPSREEIDAAHRQLKQVLASGGSGLELRLGAESFWDELFLERLSGSGPPAYTGGRAFLVELSPAQTPPRLEATLFQIRMKGTLPVLAHPERYAALWNAPERVNAIRQNAALVVDLGALDGAHGERPREVAQRLVQDRMAHAVTTDIHAPSDARAAAAGMAWIRKRLGERALLQLLEENPRRILQGELPD